MVVGLCRLFSPDYLLPHALYIYGEVVCALWYSIAILKYPSKLTKQSLNFLFFSIL